MASRTAGCVVSGWPVSSSEKEFVARLRAGDEAALAASLGRNVHGEDAPASALARYALAADRSLKTASLDALLAEGPAFPRPEAFAAGT